jgi:hypothetical protein
MLILNNICLPGGRLHHPHFFQQVLPFHGQTESFSFSFDFHRRFPPRFLDGRRSLISHPHPHSLRRFHQRKGKFQYIVDFIHRPILSTPPYSCDFIYKTFQS